LPQDFTLRSIPSKNVNWGSHPSILFAFEQSIEADPKRDCLKLDNPKTENKYRKIYSGKRTSLIFFPEASNTVWKN